MPHTAYRILHTVILPNMFDEPKKHKAKQEKAAELGDFVIHVMPEAFKQKKTVIKEEKKPVVVPKPEVKPVKKPIPIKPPIKKPVLAKKKKSKLPWILALVGFIFIVVLVVLGWFALRTVEPEIIIEEPPIEEEIEEVVIVEQEIRSGSDLDSDGLSDIEEVMYGTDVRDPDSDGDTFLDGNEVFHRYSPLGLAPQTLRDTGAVDEYENEDLGFTLTYPAQWTVAAEVDAEFQETEEVIFRTNSTATIRLAASSLEDQIFNDWYKDNSIGEDDFNELDTTLTKEGYMAYMSSGGLLSYVEIGDWVYIFKYDLSDELEIVYLQTFQMMINSFLVK